MVKVLALFPFFLKISWPSRWISISHRFSVVIFHILSLTELEQSSNHKIVSLWDLWMVGCPVNDRIYVNMNVQCCFDLRLLDIHYKKQCCFLSILIIYAKKKCIRGSWVTFIVNIIISSIVGVGAGVRSNQQRIDMCF